MTSLASAFSTELHRSEEEYHRAFAALIERFDAENPEEFSELIKAAVTGHGFTAAELANAFSVSRASISRWMAGRAVPHAIARRAIATWLRERAIERADAIRAALERAA